MRPWPSPGCRMRIRLLRRNRCRPRIACKASVLRSGRPCERGSDSSHEALQSHKAEIFRFARRPKVPLTNNRSEGDIRTARAKFHEGRESATWSTCRESAVASTAISMSIFRLPLRRPWPSMHSFVGFLTMANPLQLTRLPQLGGVEVPNPLIFLNPTPKGRHYTTPDGLRAQCRHEESRGALWAGRVMPSWCSRSSCSFLGLV